MCIVTVGGRRVARWKGHLHHGDFLTPDIRDVGLEQWFDLRGLRERHDANGEQQDADSRSEHGFPPEPG
ncbi:hypothetical protein D3C83_269530 [compost metagenome]